MASDSWCVVDAQLAGELERFGYALDQREHVGVDNKLHSAALAYFAEPNRLAADRGECWAGTGFASAGPEARMSSSPASAGALLPDTGASTKMMSGRSCRAGR